MPFASTHKILAGLLSASLIAFHTPAWAANTAMPEEIGQINAKKIDAIEQINYTQIVQQALLQVGGDPNSGGMNQPVVSKTVAVVDFANDTGEARFDNLKRGISESLVTKLAKRPELHLVERSQIDKAIKEIGFGQTAFADSSKTAQLGKMAGAGVIVTGSIVKGGSRFEINVRMLDVETGKVLVSESYGFQSENEILPVTNYLSLLIPQKLGLYVSDAELEMARTQIKGGVSTADNSWIYWTIGAGVLVIGAIVTGVVLVARANAKASEGPDIVITNPRDGSKLSLKAQEQPLFFNLPLVKF